MITFTQIWLCNLIEPDENKDKNSYPKFLSDDSPIDINRRSLAAYRAYLGIIDMTDESARAYCNLWGFKGFLSVTMQLEGAELSKVLCAVCSEKLSSKSIDSPSASEILCKPQSECNIYYSLHDPSEQEIARYQSLFECAEPDKVIRLDFGELLRILSEEDLTYFIQLLAVYLSKMPYAAGTGEGNAICGLMQGLVTRHPHTKLSELQLDEDSSARFISLAESEAIDHRFCIGYSIPPAFWRLDIILDLLSNFFVANGFLRVAE